MRRSLTYRVYLAAPASSPAPHRLLVTRVVPGQGRCPAAGLPPPPAACLSVADRRALWVLWALGEAVTCLLGIDVLAFLEG